MTRSNEKKLFIYLKISSGSRTEPKMFYEYPCAANRTCVKKLIWGWNEMGQVDQPRKNISLLESVRGWEMVHIRHIFTFC